MSNMAVFLDRVVTDGNYKTVLLKYDPLSIRDYDFVPQLSELAFGKYALFTRKEKYFNAVVDRYGTKTFQWHSNVLKIIMMEFTNIGWLLPAVLTRDHLYFNAKPANNILLISIQSHDQRQAFWRFIAKYHVFASDLSTPDTPFLNVSVIFYQTERSVKKAKTSNKTSNKTMEIFVLNYKEAGVPDPLEIDVGDSVSQLGNDNLNDKIFGSIIKKFTLLFRTAASDYNSITRTSLRGNDTLINLGSAEYYISNFIVSNLHYEGIKFKQILNYVRNGLNTIDRRTERFECMASNETIYGELYNGIFREINLFVFIDFYFRNNSISTRHTV